MNKNAIKKIYDHPDRDELISKLVMGFSAKDINEWLASKYTNVSESKFVISESSIKSFQTNYLDIYNIVQEDLAKTRSAISKSTEDELHYTVNNSQAYKDLMVKSVSEELDIRQTVKRLCIAIETRLGQVFDEIQEDPRNINTKIDRLFLEYAETLGNILEKYYKFTEAPADQVIQHNVTLQVVDQHISVFHDVIKDVLSQMDLETSLYFIEVFNDKMAKLKPPNEKTSVPSEARLAEAKLLSENINKKLSE
jgi:hypothetical protein